MTVSENATNKKATINDVAQLAGVSKKTASRVLNNSPHVSDATREKVREVMKQLNYAPDPQARGLAFKRSYIIGLVYDNPNALYISDVQKGVLEACKETGYELIMHPADLSSDGLIDEISQFATRARLDGLILLSPISQVDELAQRLNSDNIPHVRISPKNIDSKDKLVMSNDMIGAEKMTEYLVSIGHRNIGFVMGPESNLSSEQKYQGFENVMDKFDIAVNKDLVVAGENTFDSGIMAGNKLLGKENRPSAIFASNDLMALGVMRAASILNIKIPEQLSVAGYDDGALAEVVWPDLTTINQSVTRMGELAAKKLLLQLEKDNPIFTDSGEVEPTLVIRNSTKKA